MKKLLALAYLVISFVALAGLSLPITVEAQGYNTKPDKDPEGNTGLKANVDTAGGYSSYSGNGNRSITDLSVPDAVGVYGLNLTRHWNSILPEDETAGVPSGFPSDWSHSWSWIANYHEEAVDLDPREITPQRDYIYTTSITITFPDGHANKYKITRGSRPILGAPPPDPRLGPPYTTAESASFVDPGGNVHDHLTNVAPDGSSFWLDTGDGGSVHFVSVASDWVPEGPDGPGHEWHYYQAAEVFDPNGLKTTLQYGPLGLEKILQEGGKWLSLHWNYFGSNIPVIQWAETGGCAVPQRVDYTYGTVTDPSGVQTFRMMVTYPDDRAPGQSSVATYDYGIDGLLAAADDPRFDGAMTQIRYAYRGSNCLWMYRPPATAPLPYPNARLDYYLAPGAAIAAEKNLATGLTVSALSIGCWDGMRTEQNGFGAWRKFYYGRSAGSVGDHVSMGYQLVKVTDFTFTYPVPNDTPSRRQNWKDGQPRQVFDGLGHITELVATPTDDSGEPGEVRHITAGENKRIYDRVNPGSSEPQDYTVLHNRSAGHWLFSKTDENNQATTYIRDARRRIKDIVYHDGSSEHFDYNTLNQVTAHRLANDIYQHYDYDALNRVWREWNDVDGAPNGIIYTYDGSGRVETVSHAWSRAKGAAFSVKLTYNGRNKIVKEEYPATVGGPNPFKEYQYDAYGNCTGTRDELGKWSYCTYDAYRRCTSYTEPLNAPDWNGQGNVAARTWNWIYDRYLNGQLFDASTHTSRQWRVQIEPAFNAAGERHLTARNFDWSDRIDVEQTGWITDSNGLNWYWGPDIETHSYGYDANDNKIRYTDPQSRVTTYQYDLRDRLWKTIEPLNRITEIRYDYVGNKTLAIFPDTRTQQWLDYDAFGQAWRTIDERNNTTNLAFKWGPMKKLTTVTTHRTTDSGVTENQPTIFNYDGMGRPVRTTFPDNSYEESGYVLGGQLQTWRVRKGAIKTLSYDARGRETSHAWNDGMTSSVAKQWDAANRLSAISNQWSAIDYKYDDAGQVWWEGDTILGSGGGGASARRQITYFRYPAGQWSHVGYPNGAWVRHNYNGRGQLQNVLDNTTGLWQTTVNYFYLSDGKVWYQDYGNGVRRALAYDERGLPWILHNYKLAPYGNLSWRQYWRDNRDRITAWAKSGDSSLNGKENGRGDRYSYDAEGQLTDAWCEATDPAGAVGSPEREEHFNYDQLGNRQQSSYLPGRGWIWWSRTDNGLNQYNSWTPSVITYDDDVGPPWGAYGQANGVMMQDGYVTASYNALNQPLNIWSPALPWTNGLPNYYYTAFDPLGRCVKRWLSNTGTNPAEPATYFYYEGWNMIQEGPSAAVADRLYLHGGQTDEIVAQVTPANNYIRYFQYDARGDCVLQTDASGNLAEQYEYDAFGKPYVFGSYGQSLGDSSPWGNRFLFTGREWLKELRLYDYRNRLYQPELGRFLQPDPKEFEAGDYNLYRYCHNDPVNRRDPFGLAGEKIVKVDIWRKPIDSNIPIHIRYTESGNWTDTKIANHYDPNLKKDGATNAVGSVEQSGRAFDVDLNVNWSVNSRHANTDVVARELQHVRGFHVFSNAFANSILFGSVIPSLTGFPTTVKNFQASEQQRYDATPLRLNMPHNTDPRFYPPLPFMLPAYENTANEIGN